MQNCTHRDQPAKTLTELEIVRAANLSLLTILYDSSFSLRKAVVCSIGMEDLGGFQTKLHGHDVRSRKLDDDLKIVLPVPIIPEQNSLSYPYMVNK